MWTATFPGLIPVDLFHSVGGCPNGPLVTMAGEVGEVAEGGGRAY
jgi:hypothetical protein